MNSSPIGIFDSGVGGISIWKEINLLLPNEHTLYLADSKFAPYGERTKEEIQHLCVKNTEFLLSRNCKLIVVACNTATTNAIDYLRATYKVPFIGIEPAIKPAALQSKSKKIGVLATKGTLASALFHNTTKSLREEIEIFEQEGIGLVPLIEQGAINSPKLKKLLTAYLQPMVMQGIDHLVLGCTHYPFLMPKIKEILKSDIKIIDSGEAVAKQTYAVLEKLSLLNTTITEAQHCFYTNLDRTILERFVPIEESDSVKIAFKNF